MEHSALHRRAREAGRNPVVYWLVRAVCQPFFHIYFRMSRIGREHIPAEGPVIIAANHRSFLDPFVISTMVRRPMYYVAKKELFARRWQAWILNSLGAFPVDRGAADGDMLDTARTILARGDIVLIFPEGTRVRPGALGTPKRGVGRLALETGAPVVPLALIGTEAIRRGWRIRPHKVRIRAGRALRFPQVTDPSPALAGAVASRIWPCVMLQWEWLGGLPPIRRAAIVGAGSWGTSLAVCLARAGFEVDLGCRTGEQAAALTESRENGAYLPGVELPDAIRVMRASQLELGGHDLICLAVPARALPSVLAAHAERIPRRAGVLVLSKGLVPPLGTLPSAFAAERCRARAIGVLGGPSHAAEALEHSASVVLASVDRGFAQQLADALATAGLDVSITTDVTGVELAGCAKNVAV
ncbi:MAG: 1-acyl-sn-glycerol-3-phosphate acyltransferase, partial [Actinomycetota bacterium]|nr:1-acyl-sn-glycerol-3-phosphate acyltransferase [Actinomycetota bacterium]